MGAEEFVAQIVPAVASNVVKGGTGVWVYDRILNQNHCALVLSLCVSDPEHSPIVLEPEDVGVGNVLVCDRHNYESVGEHVLVQHPFKGPLRILSANACHERIVHHKVRIYD